jgi:hypothetical protein
MYAIPESCMAIFQLSKKLENPSSIGLPNQIHGLSAELINESFMWMQQSIEGQDPTISHLGHAVTLWKAGHLDEGKALIKKYQLATNASNPRLKFQRKAIAGGSIKALLED